VAKVNPDLVVSDPDGQPATLRFLSIQAMLLNEFLKEHRKVQEQQATIARLESKVTKQELTATQQQKEIEALTATVQKVSDQVALSKPAPQLVANR
jgi:predicted secreted Zn-dependent protease